MRQHSAHCSSIGHYFGALHRVVIGSPLAQFLQKDDDGVVIDLPRFLNQSNSQKSKVIIVKIPCVEINVGVIFGNEFFDDPLLFLPVDAKCCKME